MGDSLENMKLSDITNNTSQKKRNEKIEPQIDGKKILLEKTSFRMLELAGELGDITSIIKEKSPLDLGNRISFKSNGGETLYIDAVVENSKSNIRVFKPLKKVYPRPDLENRLKENIKKEEGEFFDINLLYIAKITIEETGTIENNEVVFKRKQ